MFPDWTTYSFPAWASGDEAKVWLFGFIFGGIILLFRAALRWFKLAGTESHE